MKSDLGGIDRIFRVVLMLAVVGIGIAIQNW
jgi:hypothetical protein